MCTRGFAFAAAAYQQVTHGIHLLKAQTYMLQAQGSSDSCSSPGWTLKVPGCSGIVEPIARGKPIASIHSAEPNRSPGSLKPRPLRARPRGSARTRSARHLDYSARVERPLATVVRAKSQGWGKGMPAARDSSPRSGSRAIRAALRGSSHSRVPEWPVQASLHC